MAKPETTETEWIPAAVDALLRWYEANARPLPWRETPPNPYHVWLSEIMLQQTRIETVKEYYRRFLARCPDVASLATISEEELLKLWEGLGYYSRARNLQKAAKIICEKGFPETVDTLGKLPGIGPYTAAAISSLAFGHPAVAVDGNVLRVLSRLTERNHTADSARLWLAGRCPEGQAANFTQGWMELGETLCIPNGAPLCTTCPLQPYCLACRHQTIDRFPEPVAKTVRAKKKRTVLLLCSQGKVALRKRPPNGLLAGLWEFPGYEEWLTIKRLREMFPSANSLRKLPPSRHVFTHIEWEMRHYLLEFSQELPEYTWVSPEEMHRSYSIPSAFRHLSTVVTGISLQP